MALVVLIDDAMILDRDAGWGRYVEELAEAIHRPGVLHRILPVAASRWAFVFSPVLHAANFLRLYGSPDDETPDHFALVILGELCRMLSAEIGKQESGVPPRVRLLISHRRGDGARIAKEISDRAVESSTFDTFLHDPTVVSSDEFSSVLSEALTQSALLIVSTGEGDDTLFVQREILAADRAQIPVLRVDASSGWEPRNFPYLGRIPTIRYNSSDARVPSPPS